MPQCTPEQTAAKVEAKIIGSVTRWIAIALASLTLLGAGTAFIYSVKGTADAAATSAGIAHKRLDKFETAFEKMDAKLDKIIDWHVKPETPPVKR